MQLSNAINIHAVEESKSFELINLISGKCIKVDALTLDVLRECENHQEHEWLEQNLKKIGYDTNEVNLLISKLLSCNILVNNKLSSIIDFKYLPQTLFGVNRMGILDQRTSSICLIGVPFGAGNSIDCRCKEFPAHIREFSKRYFGFKKLTDYLSNFNYNSVSDSFDISNFNTLITADRVVDCGDIFHTNGENNEIFYIKISNIFNSLFEKGHVPLAIGGDHSITYPILKSLSNNIPKFNVIHFDAHSDFRDSAIMDTYLNLNLSILNHANVMNYCTLLPQVNMIYQIGVREPFITKCSKIQNLSIEDLRNNNSNWESLLNTTLPIYVSIDVDFFDPSIVSGTASKLPNGGYFKESVVFFKEIITSHKILGIDIVEANNKLDDFGTTSNIVLNLILNLISHISINK